MNHEVLRNLHGPWIVTFRLAVELTYFSMGGTKSAAVGFAKGDCPMGPVLGYSSFN
jgi:hypothetical protein